MAGGNNFKPRSRNLIRTICRVFKSFFLSCTSTKPPPTKSKQHPPPLHRSCRSFDDNMIILSPNVGHRHSVDGARFRPNMSRKSSSKNILYSNSHGIIKPPVMELPLHCTLNDLCFGSIKKINITRHAITVTGQIVHEDEELSIMVEPGWRKGTRITFEGKHETSGVITADVIFVIAEMNHPLFSRRDDDLEMEIQLPLIDALTGCTLLVPLLGEHTESLTIDDVVYPGYEMIIQGQGMPKHNEPAVRGNLIIKFFVKFPEELTEQQRIEVASILQHAC